MSCCMTARKFLFEVCVPVCLFADLLLTSVTIPQACWWHSMPLVTQKWELVVFAQHELFLFRRGFFWLSSITPVEVKPYGRAAERLVISSLFRRGLALCFRGDWIASPPLERVIPAGQKAKWLRRLRAELLTCTVYLTCGLKKNTCISWAESHRNFK